MATTDLVPCFYTGQDYRWERPAETRARHELRDLVKQKLGEFRQSGRIFLFFKRIKQAAAQLWDDSKFDIGRGNLLPFAKAHNYGDKLHYEIPRAGDKGMRRHNLYSRRDDKGIPQLESKQLRVSSRNLFASQPIPMRPLTA